MRLARSYRRASTPAEAILWACLRGHKLQGLKFRRQHPVHGYIVDFYCAEAALVVELDGSVHLDPEQCAYDRFRDEQLRTVGLTVLRFSNTEVETAVQDVLLRIALTCGRLKRDP